MKIQLQNIGWAVALITIISSCDIKDNKDVDPSASFLRIYDSQQFDHAIGAVDVLQTDEGGYLILGNYRRDDTNFLGAYISSTDENGNFIRNTYLRDNNVHPVGKILTLGGEHYFVSMDAVGLQAYLNQIDDSARVVNTISLGVTYPTYAENDGTDQFVLSSYNPIAATSVISVVNAEGSIGAQSSFGIGAGEDVEEPIIDHFTRTGRELPFFAGRSSSGMYYVNGFYNYTLSLLFTDFSSDSPSGVVQGQQDQGGISGLLSLEGGQYAVARFNFGDNYANALATLNTGGTTASSDIESNPMLEWDVDAKVRMLNITVNANDYVVIASTTKNQQIVLHFFEASSGDYVGVNYYGYSNPYQLGALTMTADDGLAILGSTQVAGKFQRLCLFKVSAGELSDLVQ